MTTIQQKVLQNYCFSLQQISCIWLFFEQTLRLELDLGDIVSTIYGANSYRLLYTYIYKYTSVLVLNFYCLAAALQLFPLILDLLSGAGVSCARCTLIAAYNSHQIRLTCSGWMDLPLFNDECHGTSGTSKCSRSFRAFIFSQSSHISFPNAENHSAPSKMCNFSVSACSQMDLQGRK